jgi:tetratricopeptide (TPR) repeat protein
MRVAAMHTLVSALVMVFAAQAVAEDESPTVATVTANNGRTKDGWLIVSTPSILRIEKSAALVPDPKIALEQYDKLVELSSAEPEVHAESLRRSADLRLQFSDEAGNADEAELRKAIASYRRLLAEQPDYARNDRVLYQLARAYEAVGDEERAIESLRQLGSQFPASARRGDALFRTAELLYLRGRYADAEVEYRAVVESGPGAAFFEPAQYKYGWALFKQSKYDQALPIFLAILDRELPRGNLADPSSALAAVNKSKLELATDALRVVSLSFAALGGGEAINETFAKPGTEPRYYALVYAALGSMMLEKRRYSDAADAYMAFAARHPDHTLAPTFQSRAITAYQQGGFDDLVFRAKESYAMLYAPGARYWGSRQPPADVLEEVRKDLDELGRYYHAKAQQIPESDAAARKSGYVAAARWYKRTLDLFPSDPGAADISLLYADALLDGGQVADAAQRYMETAYGYNGYAKAPEAAYAAVQTYQRLAREAPPKARPEVLRQSIAASLKLADTVQNHPQSASVLARAAEDLYELMDHDQAITVAGRVLASSNPISPDLRASMLGVVADSRFAQKKYPEAEVAYTDLIKLLDAVSRTAGDTRRGIATEQLAAAIYKQGEAARDAGDLRAAANLFQRVGEIAPDAGIRANADYDAATAFMGAQNWTAAQAVLEGFRARYPAHALNAGIDKKLAIAYQQDNKPGEAAAAFTRIAQRSSESLDARRDAAWLAAQLYDKARQATQASQAYEYYLANFRQPLDRALEARRRLADIALNSSNDNTRYAYWLREIVNADAAAGAARTDATKFAAAQASLELGRIEAADARLVSLTAPASKSLPRRKAATEAAIDTLSRAAGYGFAEVTTAATYEFGMVYRDLSRALISSERPAKLKAMELEQYNLLLEEQAYPFEEKAIKAHETNLQRMRQGLWDEWIRRSAWALAELSPAKYGKRDQRELSYDSLR